jgi:hypothetical protein
MVDAAFSKSITAMPTSAAIALLRQIDQAGRGARIGEAEPHRRRPFAHRHRPRPRKNCDIAQAGWRQPGWRQKGCVGG